MAHKLVLAQIKTSIPTLSSKEQIIARYILENPREASRCTIRELSAKLNMADSTIFKFCTKFGYTGFRSFRNDLLAEEFDPQISVHEKISPDDTSYSIAQKVFQSSIQSLNDTLLMIEEKELDRAVNLLIDAQSISFYGSGGSNIVAFDAYQKFLRSPIPCWHSVDQDIQLMQAAQLTEKDAAIIVSHSGLTKHSLDVASVLKQAGCKIIVLTSYRDQPLSEQADVTLISASEETGYRSESLSTRIAQLALIDVLFTAVMFNKSNVSESLYKMRSAINLTKLEN